MSNWKKEKALKLAQSIVKAGYRVFIAEKTLPMFKRYFTKLRAFDNAFNYDDLIKAMGANE